MLFDLLSTAWAIAGSCFGDFIVRVIAESFYFYHGCVQLKSSSSTPIEDLLHMLPV